MSDLRSKADDMIEEYKDLYFQLLSSNKLLELYPTLKGNWYMDSWEFRKIKQAEAARAREYENRIMEKTLQDTFTRSDIMVEKPPHYTNRSREVIDMMVSVFGPEAVKTYCEIAAFKYRMRAGYKQDAMQDINKALWYENKMKEL